MDEKLSTESPCSGFQPLNSELRDVLGKLVSYQFDESFLDSIPDLAASTFGIEPKQLVNDILELQELGYVRVYPGDALNPRHIAVTSNGRCYDKLLRKHRLDTVLNWTGNLVTGASGGLVVFLLAAVVS